MMKFIDSNNFPFPIGSKFVCQFSSKECHFTNINELEYTSILIENEAIGRIIFYKKRLQELRLNFSNYFEQVKLHFELLNKNDSSKKYNHEFASLDINRVFNNFVISFRSLVEHTEKRILKNYGSESQEYRELKEFLSSCYDNLFSYRFLIRLRNYVIHYNQPVYLDMRTATKRKPVITPYLKKSDLLMHDEIKKKLKNDVARFKEKILIEPIMKEIQGFMNIFYPAIISILSNSVNVSASSLINFQIKYTKGEEYRMDLGILKSTKGDKFRMFFTQLEINESKAINEAV